MRILLVEDDERIADFVATALGEVGYVADIERLRACGQTLPVLILI